MDDSDMESEIQEDSIQEDSSSDGGGKMNWMLDKGLILGKKVLLTGILISSAPFVLPPLVVFSALGLAFSVPSGLAVASYACTEKIMSKLLPMPDSAPMTLAYLEEISADDKEDEMVFGGEIDTIKEEERMDDIKRGVGVMVEFVDDGKEEWIEEKVFVQQDNLGPEYFINDEMTEPVIQLGGDLLVEESGYEEDVEDDIPKTDEQPLGDIDMGVEESGDGKVRRLVIVFEKNDSNVEEIGDENPASEIQRVVVKVEKTDEGVRGETPFQVTTMADSTNENELAAESTRLLERIRDENISMEEAEQQKEGIPGGNRDETGVDNIVEAEKLMNVGFETTGVDNIIEAGKLMNVGFETTGVDNIIEAGKLMNVGFETVDVGSIMEDEQRPIVCKRTTLVIGANADNCVTEDVPFDLRKENVISSNADIREDESGFDLFDDQNAAVELYPLRVANVRIGFGGQNGRGFNPQSKVLSEKDNIVKSNEEQVPESEEKIWERIMAMRAIVGYKAPASRTCAEELKALYIFTGVEPPSSFKDPSDLTEVSSRLQFLMSIVGVK